MESSPLTFLNYIADESFRISLESDYRELTHAVSGGHWKSVHVLAGSIVEALLSDYLLDKKPDQEARILRSDLGGLIAECKTDGVLSSDTADLCVVVKNYRNLIHPGRMKRLGETVSEDRGQIALRLVKLVAEDVSRIRKDTYGYTGEQVIEKIRKDPTAFPAFLDSVANKLRTRERHRLLTKLLPDENLRLRLVLTQQQDGEQLAFGEMFTQSLRCVQLLYRLLYKNADADSRLQVLQQYLHLLHNATESDRHHYEAGLLSAEIYLQATGEDRKAIYRHLLGELRRHTSLELLAATEGVWKLQRDDSLIADMLLVYQSCDSWLETAVCEWISLWYAQVLDDERLRFRELLETRIQSLSSRQRPTKRYEKLLNYLSEDPIPF